MAPLASPVVQLDGRSRRWSPPATVAGTAAAIAVLAAAGSLVRPDLPPSAGHALSHLLVAVPLAVLTAAAARRWPPARATFPGRAGRRLVTAGLAGVLLGQVLEVLGARVDEIGGASTLEAVAHMAGQIVTMLCLPVVLAGTIASLAAAVRERAVPGLVAVVIAVAGAAALWLVAIGGG